MIRRIIWTVIVLAGLSWIIYGLLTIDRRSDEAQIRSQIDDMVTAVQKLNVSGVMRGVSSEYKDSNGYDYDRLRLFVAQALRAEIEYKASVKIANVAIDGEKAIVSLHASVNAVRGGTGSYERDLTLTWRKEPARHMLIFPTKVWLITEADNLGFTEF